jgi:hypothetical protein
MIPRIFEFCHTPRLDLHRPRRLEFRRDLGDAPRGGSPFPVPKRSIADPNVRSISASGTGPSMFHRAAPTTGMSAIGNVSGSGSTCIPIHCTSQRTGSS